MTPNAFIGKTKQPTDGELTAALGPARATWDQLLADLAQEYSVNIREWNSYSPKAGWSLRKYPEGTGVRITLKTPKDLAAVKTLAAIKLAN